MTGALDSWWHLPGPSLRLDGWVSWLEAAKSIVFVVPEGCPSSNPLKALDIVPRLKRTLDVFELGSNLDETLPPGENLWRELGKQSGVCPLHGATWAEDESLIETLLTYAPGKADETMAWLEFVEDLAEATRDSPHRFRRPRMALLIRAEHLDEEYRSRTPNLEVVRLGYGTTRLDLTCHVARTMEATSDPRKVELRAALAVELCAGDLDALSELGAMGLERLCDVGGMCEWWAAKEQLVSVTNTQELPWRCWATGRVRRVDGRNVEDPRTMSGMVLEAWVERAIWTAQARTLIPILDRIRCKAVDRYRGLVCLPHTRESGHEVHEAFRLELGDFAHLASQRLLGHIAPREFRELHSMKRARNELCHNRPIDFRDVSRVLSNERTS